MPGLPRHGSEAEPWERDDTFSLKEGVQCEMCHGPGSEYMDEDVMMDREAAMRAGLKMPTKEDCLNCHAEKGSHRIVLGPRTYDLDKAWQEIAHPTPQNWEFKKLQPPAPALAQDPGPAYTGVAVCAECHAGAAWGYQFSKWQASKHADAYASLGTAKAREMAAAAGVAGDPRTSAQCLKCHATAYHQPAAEVQDTYALHEGVSCEACHGAGSGHADEAAKRKGSAAADDPPAEDHGADLRGLPRQLRTANRLTTPRRSRPSPTPRFRRRSRPSRVTRRRSTWPSAPTAANCTSPARPPIR